ncbi:MAG: ribosome maturation factor RimM [Pseudomonadota bacterium]
MSRKPVTKRPEKTSSQTTPLQKSTRICLGAFAGAHGVRGEAKIKSFTAEPADVASYGAVESEDGHQQFTLTIIRPLKGDLLLVRAPQIHTREMAQALAGTRVYVDRSALTSPHDHDDDVYYADLIALEARDRIGTVIGVIRAVHNFGAGDILEIGNMSNQKGVHLVPFLRAAVPTLAISDGFVVIDDDFLPDGKEPINDEAGTDEQSANKGDTV